MFRNLSRAAVAFLCTLGTTFASAATSPRVADVYVPTIKGVMIYHANSAGQLRLQPGSPFAVAGDFEATNGSFGLVVGTTWIRSYQILSTGAIGKVVSKINTADYSGAQCGIIAGSVLDHTGKYLSVQLYSGSQNGAGCAWWQTFRVSPNGLLTYLGGQEYDHNFGHGPISGVSRPAISASNRFGYGFFAGGNDVLPFAPFQRENSGTLIPGNEADLADPTPDPSKGAFSPADIVADTGNHLAVLMTTPLWSGSTSPPCYLASYTTDPTNGNFWSTNTYHNMPVINTFEAGRMSMSPDGRHLAMGGTSLSIFSMNGAAPLTLQLKYHVGAFHGGNIYALGWDKYDHVYALVNNHTLKVFTVGQKAITLSSSVSLPWQSSGGTYIVVVPK